MERSTLKIRITPPLAHGQTHCAGLAGPRWEIYGDWHEDVSELETEVFYLLQ